MEINKIQIDTGWRPGRQVFISNNYIIFKTEIQPKSQAYIESFHKTVSLLNKTHASVCLVARCDKQGLALFHGNNHSKQK